MYEFQKLPEAPLLDSVPTGANVLAEVNGQVRRVPGGGLGGGNIPVFDLTAMGLPAVPLTGAAVSVECDTSALRAAMDKGPVKLLFKGNFGGDLVLPASGIFTAIQLPTGYQCAFTGVIIDEVVTLYVSITDTSIMAGIVPVITIGTQG